jgi:hypothetical protein
MSKPDERVSNETLQALMRVKLDENSFTATVFRSVVVELISRRRGEWICNKCGLRQDPAQQDSDGGIPW